MTKLLPAGEAPAMKSAVFEGRMPPAHGRDPADKGRERRPCARCGRKFLPTAKRRMLCARCYGLGGGYDD